MIYVDRKGISHPKVFFSKEIYLAQKRLDEFYHSSKSSRSQKRYSKPFEPELRDRFLDALRELFNGKCAYCESSININREKSVYDHFRPKSGARGLGKEFSNDHYWWLTYEWRNLYYSCSTCNQYKSTWFPVEGKRATIGTEYEKVVSIELPLLVDPCIDNPDEHFSYNENGSIDFITPKGKTTIEILKLNRKALVTSREVKLMELYSEWELMLKSFKQRRTQKRVIKELHEKWEALNRENTHEPYLGTQRYMLKKWLNNHPEIREYLNYKDYLQEIKLDRVKEEHTIASIQADEATEITHQAKKEIEEKLNLDLIKHVYVEKIELTNFKCFKNLEISFINDTSNASSEPWKLILGENGVGKSSLLKALAIGLSGQKYIEKLGIRGEEILRHKCTKGSIRIHLVGAVNTINVEFDKNGILSNINQPIINVLAYSSIRLKPKEGKIEPEISTFYGAKAKNLFDYTFSLVDADNWLTLISKKRNVFNTVALALKDILLLEENDNIRLQRGKAVIIKDNERSFIDELSDGYKSILYLAIDIMATLADENVRFDLAEGMVLIDEIGTHLHPRWKMEVVSRLRKTFPKIRFVVTTHEPLCLRGLTAGETIVLTRNATKEIIAINDLPDPSELRIDQILTSGFFGLNSTIDPKTEKLFEEYYSILAINEEKRTEEDNIRILELSETIPRIKHLGDTVREELVYYVIDEMLAQKSRDNGVKLDIELKEEALKRVERLWNSIDKINDVP